METTRSEAYSESIRTLFEVGTVAGMSDGQLLDRFLGGQGGGELAELAFAALVERHGPMVLRVCRARLGDDHDAQDAFQATFLILARKAGAIRRHESAASWLHGVALRVASCARRAADVRRARERAAAGRSSDSVPDSDREDVAPIVREEVGGLPEKYRTPLVLCLLDGLTHEEAAARLGWPVGTVKTRVRWARERLRTRLARRGLAPSIGAIGAALASSPAEAMSPALVRATARAALQVANGRAAIAGVASASVAKLVELGRRSLIMSWLKVVALVFASVGVLAAGASGLARQGSGPPQEQAKTAEPQTQAKTVAETPEVVEKVQEVAKSDPIAEEREIQDQIVAHLVDNESKM